MLLCTPQIIVITFFSILFVSFFVSLATTKLKQNIIVYTRVFVQLLIALFILLPSFGQDWETGRLQTETQYKVGCGQSINASIGINIGIRSINIILKANTPAEGCLKYEDINYNEKLEWSGGQTKLLQEQIKSAKHRGIPKPILWIMEYFSGREINFQYGKFYSSAGWYCQICMGSSFLCYLIALVMFQTILSYGTFYLMATGILQLLANLVWYTIRNPLPLEICFQNGNIITKYGFSFWLNYCTGIFCIILATVLIFMEYKFEKTLYILFGIDPVSCYDEVVYLSKHERQNLRGKKSYESIPLADMADQNLDDDNEYTPIYYRRKPLSSRARVS